MRIFNFYRNTTLAGIVICICAVGSAACAQHLMPRPNAPGSFSSDNELALGVAIAKFAGSHRGNYFGDSDDLDDQIWTSISVPEGPYFRLENGFGVREGCMFKECENKGIVIFNDKKVLAVGLINQHCGNRKIGRKRFEWKCDDGLFLSVFKARGFSNPIIDKIIKKWGDAHDHPKIEEISLP